MWHLSAGILGAALLHGPRRDDVEALHHHRLGQQRRQVLSVGLGILVHPPVVAHVHQDLPWWTLRCGNDRVSIVIVPIGIVPRGLLELSARL